MCVRVALYVQLFADACPKTAENFLKLCTHENDIKPSKNGLKPGQPVGFCRSQFHHAQKSFCAAGVGPPPSHTHTLLSQIARACFFFLLLLLLQSVLPHSLSQFPTCFQLLVSAARSVQADSTHTARFALGAVVQDYTRDQQGASAFEGERFFPLENFVMKHDRPGIVSMISSTIPAEPEPLIVNGSLFMITNQAAPKLDGLQVVVGVVSSGMEVSE